MWKTAGRTWTIRARQVQMKLNLGPRVRGKACGQFRDLSKFAGWWRRHNPQSPTDGHLSTLDVETGLAFGWKDEPRCD